MARLLLVFSLVTNAALAIDPPRDFLQLKKPSALRGRMVRGVEAGHDFHLVPGTFGKCEASPIGNIVFFHCRDVRNLQLLVDGKALDVQWRQLSVRHQYYRPSPYERPRPGYPTKQGWIRIYMLSGTLGSREVTMSWFRFFGDDTRLYQAGIRIGATAYELEVRPD